MLPGNNPSENYELYNLTNYIANIDELYKMNYDPDVYIVNNNVFISRYCIKSKKYLIELINLDYDYKKIVYETNILQKITFSSLENNILTASQNNNNNNINRKILLKLPKINYTSKITLNYEKICDGIKILENHIEVIKG
jgi:hypothetical protein